MSALLFNTLLLIIHLLSLSKVNGLISANNYECHYRSYGPRDATLTSDELMTVSHSTNLETSNITHVLGYTTIYSIELFEIVSPILNGSIVLPKSSEAKLELPYLNNITFVQCIKSCKTLVLCRSLFYLRSRSECHLYRVSYLPDDMKRYFATTETVPQKFIKETEGRPAYYAQKVCFFPRDGVWCGKNFDDFHPFASKWVDQAMNKMCRNIGIQHCMNDTRQRLYNFNCRLSSRLFVCTNSSNIYLHPNEPGMFSAGINYTETFESNCTTNGNKQRYDDWPSVLPFDSKEKKVIKSNAGYNNYHENGLEFIRKKEKNKNVNPIQTDYYISRFFTYVMEYGLWVPLFVLICALTITAIKHYARHAYCAPNRPGESQLDTRQMRQESTVAEHQVLSGEIHPVASQLRVILPDDDDDFIRVSAAVLENQNDVDLPPSYQECCPTLPVSSLGKRHGQREAEEDPPTYAECLKDIRHQRMAEKPINVEKRLKTDV